MVLEIVLLLLPGAIHGCILHYNVDGVPVYILCVMHFCRGVFTFTSFLHVDKCVFAVQLQL